MNQIVSHLCISLYISIIPKQNECNVTLTLVESFVTWLYRPFFHS